MSIFDPSLVGELAALVTTSMQTIKSHHKIKGSIIPWLSGIVGAGAGLGWYLVSGQIDDGNGLLGVDWENIFRGTANGIAGAVAANGAYNIQKFLPIPNVLPTAQELDQSKLKEEVATQQVVVEAVSQGVPPEVAKEAVGLEPDDPPPNEVLEEVAPTTEEVVQNTEEKVSSDTVEEELIG